MFDVCFNPLMRIAENGQFSDGQRKRPTSSPMNKENIEHRTSNIEHSTDYGAFP